MSYYDFKNLSAEQRAFYKQAAILENSAQHQNRLEAERKAFGENEKYQAELEKQSAKFRSEREAELKAEAEKLSLESNKNVEIELRERFFRANPNALEGDYNRVKDSLKDSYFVEKMKAEATAEDVMRQSGDYSRM